jgi:hypothetical protein
VLSGRMAGFTGDQYDLNWFGGKQSAAGQQKDESKSMHKATL